MKKIVRNIILGFATVLIILVVYLIITLSAGRKSLIIEVPSQAVKNEVNEPAEKQIGKIGDVNITQLDNPVYRHLDAAGLVDREFTFKRILRAEGDKWQVEKPQISFFRSDLSVIIRADTADIQTETVLKQPRPKDASFSGNVVVHIQPKDSNNLKEGFAYFDSLSFESDSSRAFTDGPIRLVSEDVQLTGRKMEFVYNARLRRLEFLRINDINSLTVKVPAKSLSLTPDANKTNENQKKLETIEAAAQTKKIDTFVSTAAQTFYKCFFNKDVRIDSNSQLILTDQFIINNILINQTPSSKTKDANVTASARQPDTNERKIAIEQQGELMPVSITCQDGILVVPMDSQRMPPAINAAQTITDKRLIDRYAEVRDKAFILGRQLTFDAMSNQAELIGSCTAKLLASSKAFDRRYSISAQRIEADFAEKNTTNADSNLKFVKAGGGIVELDIEKVEENKTLGFTKIKCYSFDYDVLGRTLSALGPGLIAVDNSKLTQKEAEALKNDPGAGKFTLKKPSYALIENFAVLDYNLASDHIIAKTDNQRLNISYLPIIDGKQGPVIRATAGKVEAQLTQTATGSTELVKLYASGGVTYDEQNDSIKGQNNKIQIVGSDLLYNNENPASPIISVWGNQSWPCFLNGAAVDGVEYNLSTGAVKKTKILAPIIIW